MLRRRDVARIERIGKAVAIGAVWAFTSVIVVASMLSNL